MTQQDGIATIAFRLAATFAFAKIDYGMFARGPDPPPVKSPYCWIRPTKWGPGKPRADEFWPGADATDSDARTVHFEIEIYCTDGKSDPNEIAETVMAALHGEQLLTSFPCLCDSGQYHKFGGTKHPEHRLTITGQFSYLVTVT